MITELKTSAVVTADMQIADNVLPTCTTCYFLPAQRETSYLYNVLLPTCRTCDFLPVQRVNSYLYDMLLPTCTTCDFLPVESNETNQDDDDDETRHCCADKHDHQLTRCCIEVTYNQRKTSCSFLYNF